MYRERNKEVPLSKLHFLASTVSSKILNTIAKAEGINFTETLTGFKHMGNKSDKLLREGEVRDEYCNAIRTKQAPLVLWLLKLFS